MVSNSRRAPAQYAPGRLTPAQMTLPTVDNSTYPQMGGTPMGGAWQLVIKHCPPTQTTAILSHRVETESHLWEPAHDKEDMTPL